MPGHACFRGLLILALCILMPACTRSGTLTKPPGPIQIVVSIPPLLGLVEALSSELGSNARIDLLVPVGTMEHGYEIPPSMISKLTSADVVVYVGLGLEPQVDTVLRRKSSTNRRAVCFADAVGIKADAHAHDHDHAHDDHAHDHSGADPHLWLDPSLVARLIPAIADALADAAADRGLTDAAERLRARGSDSAVGQLTERVAEVDAQYEEQLRPFSGQALVTAHAAWGRLTSRYNLEQAALAGLEASEPSPAAISRAVELLREKKARALFSEPQISTAAVNRIADLTGAKVYQLDPLGDGDWFRMMNDNLDAIVSGLAEQP